MSSKYEQVERFLDYSFPLSAHIGDLHKYSFYI